MLTSLHPFLRTRYLTADQPGKLRSLADDVEAIRAGVSPSASQLKEAPGISDWSLVASPDGLRLLGYLSRHPLLGTTRAMTSQVWTADDDGLWVRTLGRFYRLGKPAAAGRGGTDHV